MSSPQLNPAPTPILGRHYRSGHPVALHHHQGRITALEPVSPANTQLPWIAPSLVDLQVNGFAGIDFQQDHLTQSCLEQAVRGIMAAGCGRFLLTLITENWSTLLERLQRYRSWRQRSRLLTETIAGWHIEGPFLSPEPGYHGAHPPEAMLAPTPDRIAELRQVVPAEPLLITVAPELPGSEATIRAAVDLGCTVSLGHTRASSAHLEAALSSGATGFTHLGNACPQQLDRHDNILWRVLDLFRDHTQPVQHPTTTSRPDSRFMVSLIPDGLHVSPTLFRLLHRATGESGIFYVSDAMAAAGASPNRYTLGRLELEVAADGIVRQPGGTNFAGSSLAPIDGVWLAAEMLSVDWSECWDRFSVTPARWLGLNHGLEVGQPANVCLFELEPHSSAPPLGRLPRASVIRVIGQGQQLQ